MVALSEVVTPLHVLRDARRETALAWRPDGSSSQIRHVHAAPQIQRLKSVAGSPELVERDAVLQDLQIQLAAAARGAGHTTLIAGEAGIGKTSLLKALADSRGAAQLWWGACDALQTPHPLAPLQDIARMAETGFRSLLSADSSRVALFEAVLTELQRSHVPTLVVIEDVHWADEATLDLLRFLCRRIDSARCLLAVSYRDDELAPAL